MTTSWTRSLLFPTILVTTLAGCGTSVGSGGAGSTGSTGGSTEPEPGPAPGGTAYPGKGFIVHEWGTNTVVVGSDGSLQRGLHHEEEDLPGFVYDRIKAGSLPGSYSVEVKMETPVTYFYSDVARTVTASVAFPEGVFTQWYPGVRSFAPAIVGPASSPLVSGYADPVLDPDYPFGSASCKEHYSAVAKGYLFWGNVDVLPRGTAMGKGDLPAAPLDAYTWSYARQVSANALRVNGPPGATGPEIEQFLFYRGLGNFELPVKVRALAPGKGGPRVSLQNGYGEAVPQVFVINVGGGRGAFTSLPEGVSANNALEVGIPPLEGAADTAAYAEALGGSVTAALDATGLYHDEAEAMVNTWKRQWFATPGVRLLYLIPQSWTDASIPLSIEPAPDKTVRVMMIRVEVLTPGLESIDVSQASLLAVEAQAEVARKYFTSLGRFAEPRLRRALSLLGNPAYGDAFLASIATVETHVGTGE